LKIATDWDENSHFFHAGASRRRRRNSIPCLEHDGSTVSSHEAKSTLLFNFYSDLLGTTHTTSWSFSLQDLYPHLTVHTMPLYALLLG